MACFRSRSAVCNGCTVRSRDAPLSDSNCTLTREIVLIELPFDPKGRVADDPPAIRKRYGALAELFSYRLLAGRESDWRCIRHVDCRQKEGSEADMPRLTVKGRTCPGGLLVDPPGRSQRDACSRRCCASRSHCAIFSSFTA